MRSCWKGLLLGATLAAALAMPARAQVPSTGLSADDYHRIDLAIDSAQGFLKRQIAPEGMCVGEYDPADARFGSKTALCVYGLLSCGVSERDATLSRALAWLTKANLYGTASVAMRAQALSLLRSREHDLLVSADVLWLLKAAGSDGSYTSISNNNQAPGDYDNFSSQLAVLGIWAGQRRGIASPPEFWRQVQQHWLAQRQADGGWGYMVPASIGRTKSYGSLTAAAAGVLRLCFDNLHNEEFVRCAAPDQCTEAQSAQFWLARRFDTSVNPGIGDNGWHEWLWSLKELAEITGARRIGDHDWYAAAATQLLRRQRADGGWGLGDSAQSAQDRIAQTAFALSVLASGRGAMAVSKLRYNGSWNSRPADASNLAQHLSRTFERPTRWQVVDIDSPVADWHDAPILYISGHSAVAFTQPQVDRLRRFVLEGGMIVSESAGDSEPFTQSMLSLQGRLFPQWPAKPLDATNPLYSIQHVIDKGNLIGVSNGVRLLAVHCPTQISLGLQRPAETQSTASLELATNLYLLSSDKGIERARGQAAWPCSPQLATDAPVIRVARVRHGSNCDPEPLAWNRLACLLAAKGTRLEVSQLLEPSELDVSAWPIASITGTGTLDLWPAQLESLRRYLQAGGRLIVDGAGDSKEFAESAGALLAPLVPGGHEAVVDAPGPVVDAVLREGQVEYRRDVAVTLGEGRHRPSLRGVIADDRVAIIFSPYDITAGLVGYEHFGIAGYRPRSAETVMTGILRYLSQ